MMPGSLQARQRDQWHQVADVQAVGSRVKAVIDRDRTTPQHFLHILGAVVYQSSPFDFVECASRHDSFLLDLLSLSHVRVSIVHCQVGKSVNRSNHSTVIPAKAGTQKGRWMPAFAGVTMRLQALWAE
jgi:hypothetical protein